MYVGRTGRTTCLFIYRFFFFSLPHAGTSTRRKDDSDVNGHQNFDLFDLMLNFIYIPNLN